MTDANTDAHEHLETTISFHGTINDTKARPMNTEDWRGLEALCQFLLGVATNHREEIAAAMRRHGSNYRTGSFVAPLFGLMEVAHQEHHVKEA